MKDFREGSKIHQRIITPDVSLVANPFLQSSFLTLCGQCGETDELWHAYHLFVGATKPANVVVVNAMMNALLRNDCFADCLTVLDEAKAGGVPFDEVSGQCFWKQQLETHVLTWRCIGFL